MTANQCCNKDARRYKVYYNLKHGTQVQQCSVSICNYERARCRCSIECIMCQFWARFNELHLERQGQAHAVERHTIF